MDKFSIKCDFPDCTFEQAIDADTLKSFHTILKNEWFNTPCPECGRGVIVNEFELSTLDIMVSFEDIGALSVSVNHPTHTSSVSVNLGALRPESEETELIKINK